MKPLTLNPSFDGDSVDIVYLFANTKVHDFEWQGSIEIMAPIQNQYLGFKADYDGH
jgi:hypothetical protein